jgi:hypothetical protein
MYIYYNANVFGNNVEDCTIRAISVAEDISWDKAYIKLCNYARKRGLMLNSIESIESYLDKNYDRIKIYPYETVGEFAYDNPNGTFLVTMNGHISVIKSGHIIDTFDCSDRKILSAWYVNKY